MTVMTITTNVAMIMAALAPPERSVSFGDVNRETIGDENPFWI